MLLALTTYDRERSLSSKSISSRAEFLQAESTYKQAKATYLATVDDITFNLKRSHIERHRSHSVAREALLAAERRLELMGVSPEDLAETRGAEAANVRIGRVEIRAPLGGVIIDKHVVLGEFLQVDTQAFTVADMTKVWVDLRVYQRDLAQVRTGLRVSISAGHGIPDVDGTITYLAPTIQEDTRTILARVVLANPQGLWRPGLFIKGRIQSEETHGKVVIPGTALQTLEGKVSIFVKTREGFEPRAIRIGRRGENSVEVLDGLVPGEHYVTEGSFNLKAELGKGELSDGHNH
jgi:cobalt-zinc-cadmium efflux system membrane fusion protein